RELGIVAQKILERREVDARVERVVAAAQAVRTYAAYEQFFGDAARVIAPREAQEKFVVFADAELLVEHAGLVDRRAREHGRRGQDEEIAEQGEQDVAADEFDAAHVIGERPALGIDERAVAVDERDRVVEQRHLASEL